MATTNFTTNLALALPTTGDLSGTWGAETNSSITSMLDEALGYQAFTATGGSDTLTIPNGATGVARSIYIQLNGTGGGTVNVPATKTKMYFVFNNTASAITFKVTGQTGVSIPASAKISLVSNGTDIIIAQNYFPALTLGAALPVASGGTGTTSTTFANLTTNVTGTLPVINGGTALTVGTSGGVLAYTASGTLASSGVLAQYGVVIGGGAGAVPTSTAVGTATHVLTSNGAGVAPTFQVPAAGGASLSNDTSTATNLFPMFASATSGTPTTVFTSNTKLLYKPSTGELQASELVASNGIFVNNTTVAVSYTIASGTNGFSVGPITIASGQSVTVSSGQRYVVL